MKVNVNKATLLIATALVLCFAVAAHAQPHEPKTSTPSVQLGDKLIYIPSPEGYEEATTQFEAIKNLFLATEAPVNDLLLGHLRVADCKLLREGKIIPLTRYTKVSVLRAARESPFSDATMADVVAEFRKNGAALLDPDGATMKEVIENVEKGLAKLGPSKQFDFTQSQHLGEFDVRPDVYSVMFLMTYKMESQGTQSVVPVLATLTFLKTKNRLVYVAAYQAISSTAALKTELKPGVAELKQFTTKWVNEILAANREAQ